MLEFRDSRSVSTRERVYRKLLGGALTKEIQCGVVMQAQSTRIHFQFTCFEKCLELRIAFQNLVVLRAFRAEIMSTAWNRSSC
jgi:hypothetical protein